MKDNEPPKNEETVQSHLGFQAQNSQIITLFLSVLAVVLNKLCCSSQAAVPESIWLSSSMVQEALKLMAEETSDDASTS